MGQEKRQNMANDDLRVAVYEAAYDSSMDGVIRRVLSEFPLPWKGKRVLVKPNMLTPHPAEKGVTTHPSLVSAVVKELQGRGAEVLVGDNPGIGGYGMSEKVARVSGILQAADGCFVNLAQNPVRHPVSSRFLDHAVVARHVLDADVIVNLPKLKTHVLTCITAAVKNTFGYLVGGDKMRVHSCARTPRQFAEALLDVYRIRPPELTIVDAVVAMEGNGPSKGPLRSLGKVLAGTDAISVDTVAAAMIGQDAASVPHLAIARRRGLGETTLDNITVSGAFEPVPDFKLPTTFVPGIMGVVLNRFLSRWVNCVPEVMDSLCVSCGICVDHCPVGAMQMEQGRPKADRDGCIHCYCCQEMCPEGAIDLSGRTINLLRRTYVGREHEE